MRGFLARLPRSCLPNHEGGVTLCLTPVHLPTYLPEEEIWPVKVLEWKHGRRREKVNKNDPGQLSQVARTSLSGSPRDPGLLGIRGGSV